MQDLWSDLRGHPAPHSGALCGVPTRAGTPCRIDAATCGWHTAGQRARAAHPSNTPKPRRAVVRLAASGPGAGTYTYVSKRLRHLNRLTPVDGGGDGPDGDGGEPLDSARAVGPSWHKSREMGKAPKKQTTGRPERAPRAFVPVETELCGAELSNRARHVRADTGYGPGATRCGGVFTSRARPEAGSSTPGRPGDEDLGVQLVDGPMRLNYEMSSHTLAAT